VTAYTMLSSTSKSTRRSGRGHLRRTGGDHPPHRQRIPRERQHRRHHRDRRRTLPLRPVAVTLGKSVNNGWGAFECCWARTVLACLVGALENAGRHLGTTVRLNRPARRPPPQRSLRAKTASWRSNSTRPTRKHWVAPAHRRNAHRTLVPIVGNSAWSQALGPTQLAWMFQRERPDDFNMPKPTLPDIWFMLPLQPGDLVLGHAQPGRRSPRSSPSPVCFAYTVDETNYFADLLLPEATDLESACR
jgi:phenylacetyl-CoA:acceptor oxidoreductase